MGHWHSSKYRCSYLHVVIPILLYGSEVWGFANTQNIEVFQNQYFKHLLKLGGKTINNVVLGEREHFKIEKYIKQRMLNFWVRIATSKLNKVCLEVYHKMRELYDTGEYKSDWLSYIGCTLKQLQLDYLWKTPPNDMSPSNLKIVFDEKWYYSYQWLTEIENSNACDSYSIFKSNLQVELYLLLLDPKYSIRLCKFKAGNHRLPIVTGRFNNIDRQDRICGLCNLEDFGDKYHYLLKCSHYYKEGKDLIKDSYTVSPNTLKMS